MIIWELHPAPRDMQPRWLDEVWEMRGRVLYDGGRRAGFRLAEGRFADSNQLDQQAHHLLARVDGALVGCVRLLPVSASEVCLTERLLGPGPFAKMLACLGVNRSQSIEAGRWIVDPSHRDRASRIAMLLAAGGAAAARAFGFAMGFCAAGTRDKQDLLLARLGLQQVPELPLIFVPELDDELRVLYLNANSPALHLREFMDTMAAVLQLAGDANVTAHQFRRTRRCM